MENLHAYWETRLANIPTLELPADHPYPALQSFDMAQQQFSLPPDLVDGLQTLRQREHLTLFDVLVAAFNVLLHRYSNQDDILIATPAPDWRHVETDLSSKYFSTLMALRSDLSGNPSFRELLAKVQKVTVEAKAHQYIPSTTLEEALHLQSDRNRNSLFQVMFIFHPCNNAERQENQDARKILPVENNSLHVDICLELTETLQNIVGSVQYTTDLFESTTIDRLIGHYRTLLEGIVAQPDALLSELPLLTAAEHHQLLFEWNDTATAYPKDKCIHELFEAQAAATPGALAVVYEDQQLTYTLLNTQANQLAHYLLDMGVKADARVAICVERSVAMTVALLAILKAGGTFVPIDPSYPSERLAFMLEDCAPVALLTQGRLKYLFDSIAKSITVIDLESNQLWSDKPDTTRSVIQSRLTSENLAYLIYTSGTSGQPKGTPVSHRNIVHSTLARLVHYPDPITGLLLPVSFAFDSFVGGFFWVLSRGGYLCLPSDEDAKEPAALAKLIARWQLSHLLTLPSFYALLLKLKHEYLNTLTVITVGGESCSIAVGKLHYELLPQAKLYNDYGPTECSVWSSVHQIMPQDLDKPISIGRPISNARIYILDTSGNPAPIGVPGELFIGGEGVVSGYWNRPELTDERFVRDPFDDAGNRMYKTGDLARWRSDGTIEFLGRNDFQVKIRGFRIELGDIEAKLQEHAQILETAVDVYKTSTGDTRLVAYVVCRNPKSSRDAELRDFLKSQLPEFMIPSKFVFLDALPLTPNGKLDRKALPRPNPQEQELEREIIPPRNSLQAQLVEIWRQVLGLERIGIANNFFELGGHSLLAVMVMTEVNKLFARQLPLATIYRAPTIEALAAAITSDDMQMSWYSLVPIQMQGSRPPLFAIHTITLQGLPNYLGNDQPLYFLRYGMAAEGGSHSVRLPQLEDLANHYIQEMQQMQPQGPYYLIGFSFGGLIAYEMATQLEANGHQVKFLGLLDTYLAIEKQRLPLSRIIYKFIRLRPSSFVRMLINKLNDLRASYQYGRDFWPHIYTSAPDIACGHDYQPQAYNGPVTLFQGWLWESMFSRYTKPDQEWKKLVGDNLEVWHIPGTHFEIFDEANVKVLAALIVSCMDKAIDEEISGKFHDKT